MTEIKTKASLNITQQQNNTNIFFSSNNLQLQTNKYKDWLGRFTGGGDALEELQLREEEGLQHLLGKGLLLGRGDVPLDIQVV